MPANNSPGINWPAICEDVKAGKKSLRAIARDHGISHVAIIQRRDREGWLSGGNVTELTGNPALANSLTTQNALEPIDSRGRQIKTRDAWTSERAQCIVARIEAGESIKIACAAEGITPKSFERWREYDADLAKIVDQTRNGHLGKMQRCKADAADRGDWRSAHSILEHAPETRDAYKAAGGPGAITFIINVPRADDKRADDNIIDVTPDE